MSSKKKPAGKPAAGSDKEYLVEHISRAAWEEGQIGLPGLAPKASAPPLGVSPALEDVAADMAMTGELPIDLIREVLRQQEEEEARAAKRDAQYKPLKNAWIEAAEELPTRREVEAAKQEMRALKAKRPVKEPKPPKPPKEPKQRELPLFVWAANTLRLFFLAEKRTGAPADALSPADAPLYELRLGQFFLALYRSVYYFGLRFARPILQFTRYALPFVIHPFLALWHILRAFALTLRHLTLGRFQRALAAANRRHQKRLRRRTGKVGALTAAREFAQDYKRLLLGGVNTLLPLSMAVVLLVSVNLVSAQTYALSVTYDGNPVGYVSDESVFLEAQALANRYMEPLALSETDSDQAASLHAVEENKNVYAQFALVRVRPEELTSADLLCDQLLKKSPNEMISVCGVYIGDQNGENRRLVATIKNGSDALSVLESIKNEKSKKLGLVTKPGDTVNFIQTIDLVPGFYPKDQMSDAKVLLTKLGGTKRGQRTVTLKPGEDPYGVAKANGITYDELLRMNPKIKQWGETRVPDGAELIVSQEVGYLEVKVVRTETRVEKVKFERVDTPNYNLYTDEIHVRVKGVEGQDEITERVTYINGVKTGKPEFISRRRTVEPVTERRDIGKKVKVTYSRKPPSVKKPTTYYFPATSGGFIWPVPGCHRVSSGFGYRKGKLHKGIDIADGHTYGKTVVAAKAGVVEMAHWYSSYGNCIVINHGGGVKTRYAHLSGYSVREGNNVSAGQPIGTVGSTGRSTGPHLHFEVIIGGGVRNPLGYVRP